MPGPQARVAVLAALIAVACSGPTAVRAPASTAPNPSLARAAPQLLVTIVVDQLAAWIADERWPELPPEGGFARLRHEGLYVKDMRYEHACTDTAPGHAALFTGQVPRHNGIFANETIPADGGAARSILTDPRTKVVGVTAGIVDRAGSSLTRLRGETVADRFVAEVPGAQVFSFSLKDRGALFGAGRTPTAALWLDLDLGELVTSTAFPPPPSWAAVRGGKSALSEAAHEGWSLTEDERRWVGSHAQTSDDQPGEGDYQGMGTSFPHAVRSPRALRATPLGDEILLSVARAAVDVAQTNHRPTLLALSLSSNDYVSHVFGPHSWEAWDELYRLDRSLGEFLAYLDGHLGPTNYAVMLTADHGSLALPELAGQPGDPWCAAPSAREDRWQRGCGPRFRIEPKRVIAPLEAALAQTLGPGPWTTGIAEPYLYLTPKARALSPDDRARLLATVTRVLGPLGVDEVLDRCVVTGPCSKASSSLETLVCRSIPPGEGGDLYLLVKPGAFFDPALADGRGTSHGSPYLYDRAVPLLVRAPGRVPAGQVWNTPVSFASFARTASSLLGIRAPTSEPNVPDPIEDFARESNPAP